MKAGNYYLITTVINNEVLYLRPGFKMWSRSLHNAHFFRSQQDALKIKNRVKARRYNPQVMTSLAITRIDIYGKSYDRLDVSFCAA